MPFPACYTPINIYLDEDFIEAFTDITSEKAIPMVAAIEDEVKF